MIPPRILVNLRTSLASLYPDEQSARRIVHDAGLDPIRIQFSGRPIDIWFAILTEADKSGQIGDLLNLAHEEYKDNDSLQAAYADYRRLIEQSKASAISMPLETQIADLAERMPVFQTKKPSQIFVRIEQNAPLEDQVGQLLSIFLTRAGHTVHHMRHTSNVNLDEMAETKRAMRQSGFMIVLLSEASLYSEMLVNEIEYAVHHHIRLLVLRIKVAGDLPYQLLRFSGLLPLVEWHNSDDTVPAYSKILNYIEEGGIAGLLKVTEFPSSSIVDDRRNLVAGNSPPPYADPRFIELLSEPGGALDIESQFYVPREADQKLVQEIDHLLGTITTIRAPRQCGKSSLLYRSIVQAKRANYQTVHIDLEHVDRAKFQDSQTFLYYLGQLLIYKLRLPSQLLKTIWSDALSPSDNINTLFEEHILAEVQEPVVIAMDEVERLLGTNFHDDFFGLVRFWHNRRALDHTWEKLKIIMVISTEPHLLIRDPNRSPFNVGQRLELTDFNLSQIAFLNQQYRFPLPNTHLAQLADLLGGHPYLTQLALYKIVKDNVSWARLLEIAASDDGPFRDHLQHYLWRLQDATELVGALRQIMRHERCSDEVALHRLKRAGLVQGHSDACRCRCQLYERYFKGKLL